MGCHWGLGLYVEGRGGIVPVCGPHPQGRPVYFSRTDMEEGPRWDLGWFETCFRVSEIPRVEAKDSCFRTGQPQDWQV